MSVEKYLVTVCAHVNSEYKLNILINQLEELQKENIDICLSINSSEYFDLLSKYVKYFIYDNDNNFVYKQYFMEHADIVHNSYGQIVYNYFFGENNKFYYFPPIKSHSKPALKLFRNSCAIANANGYKWFCLLQYDLKKPIQGYKSHIEKMIKELEIENKNAYYYIDHNNIFWGNIFIVNTSLVNNSLFSGNWHESAYSWINFWGNSIYEYAICTMISKSFDNSIITKNIVEETSEIWGIDNYMDSSYSSNLTSGNHLKLSSVINSVDPEFINIVPKKQNNDYSLHLFITSLSSILIKEIKIKYDDIVVHEQNNLFILDNHWILIDLPSYKGVKKVSLSYDRDILGKNYTYNEFFYTKNIEALYNNVLSIQ